eukprot:9482368-Pyramimonas_sp.AAC.1
MWDRIYFCWRSCDEMPILIAEGDFCQLPPPVENWRECDCRNSRHLLWSKAYELKEQHRCSDPEFLAFQTEIREGYVSDERVNEVLGEQVLSVDASVEAFVTAWQRLPQAMVFCATQRAQNLINNLAVSLDPSLVLANVPVWRDDEVHEVLLRLNTRIVITRND